MTFHLRPCLLALASLLAAPSALAEELLLTLDPAKTTVAFTLGATLHTVSGTLGCRHGKVLFDTASGEASGEIVLDARSARTGNRTRDAKMHKEVLESPEFPEIAFWPEEVSGELAESGSSQIVLVGQVGIRGGRHPFRLVAQIQRQGRRVSGVAATVAPYVAWGLGDPSTFVLRVDKEVTIEIALEGDLEAPN